MAGQLIVSISGISDQTLPDVAAFCEQLDARAVPSSFLVAPRLKGGYRLDEDPSTVAWLAARRTLGDAIVLHGFDEAATKKRRGEFATLPAHEANLRLMGADRVLEHLGLRTRLFAAPGWTVSQGPSMRRRATASGWSPVCAKSPIWPAAPPSARGCSASARASCPNRGGAAPLSWQPIGQRGAPASCGSALRRGTCANRDRARPCSTAIDLALMHQCAASGLRMAALSRADRRRRTARYLAAMAHADVLVVGAGLAGLVAACELAESGRRVLIVDQENAANIGGQAFWSFGGLFFVDSPEQRRLGITRQSRTGPAGPAGHCGLRPARGPRPRQRAHAYVDFAAGERAAGCATVACGPSRSWAGPSEAATTHAGTATLSRASTSPGHRPGDRGGLRASAASTTTG